MMETEMTDDKTVNVNFRRADYERIEDWRRAQPEIPSLAASVRAFALQGLKAATADKPTTTKRRSASSSDDVRHPNTAA
jgi:hypothetical protein